MPSTSLPSFFPCNTTSQTAQHVHEPIQIHRRPQPAHPSLRKNRRKIETTTAQIQNPRQKQIPRHHCFCYKEQRRRKLSRSSTNTTRQHSVQIYQTQRYRGHRLYLLVVCSVVRSVHTRRLSSVFFVKSGGD